MARKNASVADGYAGPGQADPHDAAVLAFGTGVKRNVVAFVAPHKDRLLTHAHIVEKARNVGSVHYRQIMEPSGRVVDASIYDKPGQPPLPPPKSILSRVQFDFETVKAHKVKAYSRVSTRITVDPRLATVANLNKAAKKFGKKFQ